MKKLLIGLGLSLCAATGFAHEGQKHSDKLTGEIVDITCYLDHGSSGAAHAECARSCIAKGMPVGILSGGKLYAVVIGSHESPNEKLADMAGKMVTITGHKLEKNGMRAIDMETVELAPTGAALKKRARTL